MAVIRSIYRGASRLVSDTRGATLAVMAITMATLIGFAGLGVETGLWFSEKRHYQTAADAGAIAGAFQLAAKASFGPAGPSTSTTSSCTSVTTICGAAVTEATNNGYTTGNSNAITVSEGTWSGGVFTATTSSPNAVQVVITEPKNSLLAVTYEPSVTIGVSAVAKVDTSFGHPCMLALDTNVSTKQNPGILFQGSVNMNIAPCAIASNTPGPDSILFQGGSSDTINAGAIYGTGAITDTGTPNITLPAGQIPVSGAPPIPDPYSSQTISPSGPSQTVSGNTLSPGIYQGGITLSGGGPYTMSAGTYYVSDGDFTVKNATVTGTDVTIVLTTNDNKPNQIGAVQIQANAAGNLSAPDVGTDTSTATYPGFLFIQDRRASPAGSTTNCKSPTDLYDSNATMNFAGTIYTPSQPWCINGNPGIVTGTNCLQWVGWELLFQGNPAVADSGCPASTKGSEITNVVLAQ